MDGREKTNMSGETIKFSLAPLGLYQTSFKFIIVYYEKIIRVKKKNSSRYRKTQA